MLLKVWVKICSLDTLGCKYTICYLKANAHATSYDSHPVWARSLRGLMVNSVGHTKTNIFLSSYLCEVSFVYCLTCNLLKHRWLRHQFWKTQKFRCMNMIYKVILMKIFMHYLKMMIFWTGRTCALLEVKSVISCSICMHVDAMYSTHSI